MPHAPRLHDRGVALLPVWAVEYSVLRQPARAFVSAMRAGPDPKVAGVTHYGAHALRYILPTNHTLSLSLALALPLPLPVTRYMLPTALAGGVAGGVGALAAGGLGCVSVAGGAAAAGGGAPKENVGAFALSLLASFFSSSSSSPQFVAFVSKSDMAARGVGEAAA